MTASLLAGLLIFQGLLGLITHCIWGFNATPYAYHLAIPGLLLSAAQIWMGDGLRRGRPAARWLALGACLVMIIGGVLIPITIFLTAGYLELFLAGWGMRTAPGWLVTVRWLAVLLTIYFIVAAVIAYISLRYLRTPEGRLAYGATELRPGVLPHESFGWVLLSAVVWLAASRLASTDVTIMANSLPRALLTSDQKRLRDENDAKQLAEIAGRAYFSADSKHVVFPSSTLSPEMLVLDLKTGGLRRTGVQSLTSMDGFHDPVAPDASSLVSAGNVWRSLRTKDESQIKSLSYGHLGLHSPTRMLQYDAKAQKLELVALDTDRKVYSLPVPQSQRGNPSDEKPFGWSSFSQHWSVDRRFYAWMNRDNTLSVLDVAAGNLQTLRCRFCNYGFAFGFSASSRKIFVPDHVSGPPGSGQEQIGGLLDIDSGQWTAVEYRGDFVAVADDGAGIASREHPDRALQYQEIGASARRWSLKLAETFGPPRTYGDSGRLMTYEEGPNSGATLMLSLFESPEERKPVRFVKFSSTSEKLKGGQPSRDGRYLLRVDGPRIEILDIEAALNDQPALRTMDVLKDDELSKPVAAVMTTGVTGYWTEIEGPNALSADPLQDPQNFEQQPHATMDLGVPASESIAPVAPEPTVQSGGIVKCADSSGSVTFTQGACPAGTRALQAPTIDSAPSQPYSPRAAAGATSGSTRSSGRTLSEAIGPNDQVERIKMLPGTCAGYPKLKPSIGELTILRATNETSVIYSTRRNKAHKTFGAALADACEEALEKERERQR